VIDRKPMVRNRKGRLLRPFLVCGVLLAAALAAPLATSAEGGRLRPPAALACERNQLTSYSGRVSGYKPARESTWIQISTDEDSLEALTIKHPGQADASAHYLLHGQAFHPADRAKIEKRPGKLVAGTRAVAWVCLDGKTAPLIDWQPPQT
jgi:hypothetical protein